MSENDFSSLGLIPALYNNLLSLNFQQMTGVQQQCLPLILAGQDVIAQASTGSGKTAAFALAILQRLEPRVLQPQALVLCPTRELADQVANEFRRLARLLPNIKVMTLCGGRPVAVQASSLEHGAHIVVGTPGRIEDHLRRGSLHTGSIRYLVLDEADRMLDMGFLPSVHAVVAELPAHEQRQTLLFSATFEDSTDALAASVMHNPVRVTVDDHADLPDIEQLNYRIRDDSQRQQALETLLQHYQPATALVFCSTRADVDEVCGRLNHHGFSALGLHGDMEQRDRDIAMIRFVNGSARVLVATDIAARGLDVQGLDLVVNYQPARDEATHTHRIGRTGRAGATGRACSLVTAADGEVSLELPVLSSVQNPRSSAGLAAEKVTLWLDAGKRDKIRPGDVLGALTADGRLRADDIGKITLTAQYCCVAVAQGQQHLAVTILQEHKLKGKRVRCRILS